MISVKPGLYIVFIDQLLYSLFKMLYDSLYMMWILKKRFLLHAKPEDTKKVKTQEKGTKLKKAPGSEESTTQSKGENNTKNNALLVILYMNYNISTRCHKD